MLQGRQNAVGLTAMASQRPTSALTALSSRTLTTSHAWHNSHPTPAPSHTHHNAAGVRTADARKEMVEITFTDGSSSFFPYCWLRDNCQCPQCFDSDALCRKLTLEDWQHSDCPTSVQDLWSTEMELPRMDYNGVMHGDKELLDFLVTLEKKGVVVLTDAPREPEAVLTIIKSIGYVKPTHYGTNYPIRSKASASSLAYTDQRLGMHNDLPYFQYVPGIIFLHCITQFEGKGGENDLADGFHVADYLKQFHPKEYHILTNTPVYFWDKGVAQVKQETTEYHKIVNIPIIV
ncbi:Gamma-butyrobetaine dioxygenase [Portunus trituberculatus]|uniref:Gamma-butyrobetaine dioxygenase n=1 Tax=Portunus trituberculatus TaxID=210409 RepID=A0A5B7FBU2_PORTR|nr:Gamma-butyrobetaine dioxygenase [Portunus trituberculatus]